MTNGNTDVIAATTMVPMSRNAALALVERLFDRKARDVADESGWFGGFLHDGPSEFLSEPDRPNPPYLFSFCVVCVECGKRWDYALRADVTRYESAMSLVIAAAREDVRKGALGEAAKQCPHVELALDDHPVLQAIRDLTVAASPSPSKIAEMWEGWRDYFRRARVPADRQEFEFARIMTARVQCGRISVVAPTEERPW